MFGVRTQAQRLEEHDRLTGKHRGLIPRQRFARFSSPYHIEILSSSGDQQPASMTRFIIVYWCLGLALGVVVLVACTHSFDVMFWVRY